MRLFPLSRILVLVFVFVFVFIFMCSCCQSESNNSSGFCVSSCGNIKNISYPFCLNTDPFNCGDPNYELDCINNLTVANFTRIEKSSKKYIVQSINYNNNTIRVVDPGLINPTICSFPVIPYSNLYRIPNENLMISMTWGFKHEIFLRHDYNIWILFISCVDPISDSSSYIDISFCKDRNTSMFSSTYRYIRVVDYDMLVSELPDTCGVEEVAVASVYNGALAAKNYSSLVDIHRGLSYGFELSWLRVRCSKNCNATDRYCTVEDNISEATCTGDGYYTCPADSPIVKLDLWPFRIHFQKFSSRLWSFAYSPGSGGHRHITSFCYFSFWVRGVGQLVIIGIGGILVIRCFIGLVCLIVLVVSKWRRRHLSGDETIEDFLQGQTNLLPIKYSFSDIKKMTNNFKHKLGEGGYGIVYKGKLRSGPLVAVKMTNKSISSEREFSNEVGTIGRVHHVNVVQLIGFCIECSKHVLVYEYMPNGSLDKYISPTAGQVAMTYKNMFDISLGVAHGIDYLHKGCDMQILHFDIKPHNILS